MNTQDSGLIAVLIFFLWLAFKLIQDSIKVSSENKKIAARQKSKIDNNDRKTVMSNDRLKFDNELVERVSNVIQRHMKKNNILTMTADECADLLAENGILPNDVGPKPGFNFRQLLRDGRDGKVNMVSGAYQSRPRTKWHINKIDE